MSKKQIGLCFLGFFGLLYSCFSSAAILGLDPAVTNIGTSSSFDVDVVISDLGGDIVGGFDVTIGYDPSLLTATNVGFTSNLGSPLSLIGFDLATPGEVNANETSLLFSFELDALQPGDSVRLATLSFMANNVGTASLLFTSALISDELGVEIPLQAVVGASVEISAIPIPGALWLMISGLLGLGAMGRKRRSSL